jgi:hypothetical protein
MEPDEKGRPGVYARLAEEAEVEATVLTPPRGARVVGWVVCLAIIGTVIAAAFGAHPW